MNISGHITPGGWVMCSGSNGASNLITRLVTHADVDTGDTNNVGETGLGASSTVGHVLTVSNQVANRRRYYHRQPGLHQYCRREYREISSNHQLQAQTITIPISVKRME
jgi:hypothetical protein